MGDFLDSTQLGLLARAVESGDLRLEDGTAERCAEACDALIAELDLVGEDINNGRWRPKFGSFTAGEELADKFAMLAAGPESSLLAALRSHVEVIVKMRDLFQAAGRAYREAEDANAATLSGTGEQL